MKPYLLILAVFAAILLSACGNDNPLAPQQSQPEATEIDTSGPWVTAALPSDLNGEWLLEGVTFLRLSGNSASVASVPDPQRSGDPALFLRAERSADRYRLHFLWTTSPDRYPRYGLLYIQPEEDSRLRVAWTKGIAQYDSLACSLPPDSTRVLVRRGTWVGDDLSTLQEGKFISDDNHLYFEVADGKVSLDGRSWQVLSAETDYTDRRYCLQNGNSYRMLYVRSVVSSVPTQQARLSPSTAASQSAAAGLPLDTDWVTVRGCEDFLSMFPLAPGARWVYDYSYSSQGSYNQGYSDNYSIDYKRQGDCTVEVNSVSALDKGGFLFDVQVRFDIHLETYTSSGVRMTIDPDSVRYTPWYNSWTVEDTTLTREIAFEVEPDTVWLVAGDSRLYFSRTKYRFGSGFDTDLFQYPDSTRHGWKPSRMNPNIDFSWTVAPGQGITELIMDDSYGGIMDSHDYRLEIKLRGFSPGTH
ncbi:hypothetical protein LLH00_11860 [bacterium]|nr:hypothetical protein [bacterium]